MEKKKHSWPSRPGGSTPGEGPAKGSQPLPDELRHKMETALGRELGDVRVMTNSSLPTTIGAKAFAMGQCVHFAPGAYNPHTTDGQRLLAHELTHVVQQGGPSKQVGSSNNGGEGALTHKALLPVDHPASAPLKPDSR
jgi:hypothetical protein